MKLNCYVITCCRNCDIIIFNNYVYTRNSMRKISLSLYGREGRHLLKQGIREILGSINLLTGRTKHLALFIDNFDLGFVVHSLFRLSPYDLSSPKEQVQQLDHISWINKSNHLTMKNIKKSFKETSNQTYIKKPINIHSIKHKNIKYQKTHL